ncbi:MAG: hypothetical protein HKN92_06880 [Chitinophagales bacterium]|nr:hypothetical protein [Chitinophagales bacterium]
MIILLINTIAGVLFTSCLIFFRKSFYRLVLRSVNLLDAVLSRSGNEEERQRLLLSNFVKTISSYYKFSFFFGLALFVGILPIILQYKFLGVYLTISFFESFQFIIPFSVGSTLPFLVFNQFSPKKDYSELSILIHRMMMDNLNFAQFWFSVEKFLFIRKRSRLEKDFVVVSGLARCGTTALTNILYQTKEFHALTYRNVPGLMSPVLWKLLNFSSKKRQERSHGDGIMIDTNSVEALDEFFWKSTLKDEYISDEQLTEHEVSDQHHLDYLKYQSLIRSSKNAMSTYLTKNNNFMLRYKSIRKMNSEFKVILMFRDPVDHALSLQNQHRKHGYLQEQDPFILEYMNWLGHHEFGSGQKSFRFPGLQKISSYEKDSLNFWMEQWVNYYNYVRQFLNDDNIILMDYIDFLSEPHAAVKSIEEHLNMIFSKGHVRQFINRQREMEEAVDPVLAEKAYSIFAELQERKIKLRKAV